LRVAVPVLAPRVVQKGKQLDHLRPHTGALGQPQAGDAYARSVRGAVDAVPVQR